jgi:hypothetical protein
LSFVIGHLSLVIGSYQYSREAQYSHRWGELYSYQAKRIRPVIMLLAGDERKKVDQ